MTPISVPFSKLDFDLHNPRYTEQSSQRDAFEKTLLDHIGKTQKLAEHIVANGQNPIDLIAAFETDDRRFVVLEGNRRTAVLKALNKPVLLNSLPSSPGVPAFVKRMKLLASRVEKNAISKVGLVVFPSREDADVWISLKHTGENEGAGTVSWDGTQSARFRKGDAGLNLIDFGKANHWFSEDELTERGAFPISTFNRLLGDPTIRKALGLELSSGKLLSTVPAEELAKGITQVVSDLATGKWNVTKLKSKADRKQYLDQLPKGTLPASSCAVAGWIVDQDLTSPTSTRPALSRVRSRPTNRNALIPKECVISTNPQSPRLHKIYRELKQLSVAKHENAVAVLLRTYIELSLDDFIARESVPVACKNPKNPQGTLAEKATSSATYLKARGKLDKTQEAIVHRLVGAGPDPKAQSASITTLHGFVHSRHSSPIASELLTIWDNISAFVRLIAHV
ncbi:MAG: hypothetical protein Q8K12_04685 [Thiobacillus sp.]|nr:hypothetical protein [Thiobacillus sp.]